MGWGGYVFGLGGWGVRSPSGVLCGAVCATSELRWWWAGCAPGQVHVMMLVPLLLLLVVVVVLVWLVSLCALRVCFVQVGSCSAQLLARWRWPQGCAGSGAWPPDLLPQ